LIALLTGSCSMASRPHIRPSLLLTDSHRHYMMPTTSSIASVIEQDH